MGTYRKEWNCCGSVTETEAWEPEVCPFCDITEVTAAIAAERERCAKLAEEYATWGGSNFHEWFNKLAAAIRADGK
jgi:hypothetical protein